MSLFFILYKLYAPELKAIYAVDYFNFTPCFKVINACQTG